jgi:hypothetical protein
MAKTEEVGLLQQINIRLDDLITASGGATPDSDYHKLKTQANDLVVKHVWLDGGTNDQRISTITYSSVSLGLTATKTFTYYGGAGTYHVDKITYS